MAKIEDEILQVLGGQFHVAAVGPDAVAELRDRIRARPGHYLGALRRMVMGDAFDPRIHADLHISALLNILRDSRADEVATIARSLLRLYDGVLVAFDGVPDRSRLEGVMDEETINLMFRLNTRRLELRALLEQIGQDTGGGPQ